MKKIISLGLILGVGLALAGCQKDRNDLYSNTAVVPIMPPVVQEVVTNDEAIDAFTLDLGDSVVPTDSAKTVESAETKTVETKVEEVIKTVEAVVENDIVPYSFNKCGTRWQFKEEAWYPGFAEKLRQVPVLTNFEAARMVGAEESQYTTAQEAIDDYGTLGQTNVAYVCRSTGEEIAIMMLNGSTDTTGGLARYDIENKILALAPVEPYENMYLYSFMARAGDVIPLKAGIKDDNCTYTYKVDYNFMTNQANPVRKCSTCGDGAESCESLLE